MACQIAALKMLKHTTHTKKYKYTKKTGRRLSKTTSKTCVIKLCSEIERKCCKIAEKIVLH